MTVASLMPNGKQQFFNSAGGFLAAGKVYTYAATTITPKATYTTAAASVQNANPVILDARGEKAIFWSGAYYIEVYDSANNLIYSQDNYTPPSDTLRTDLAASSGATLSGYLSPYTDAILTTVGAKLNSCVCALDFYANGASGVAVDPTGVVDSTLGIQAALNTKRNVYLPLGTYKISASLILQYYGQKLFGDGPNNTNILAPIANLQAVWIKGNYADTNSNNIPRNISINDLSISGVGSTGTSVGLEIGQCASISVTNVIVHDFASHGVVLKRPNHLFNIKLDTVAVISCGAASGTGWGVYCDPTNETYLLNMTNCWLSSNTTGSALLYTVGASINGCGFAGSPKGLYLQNTKDAVFSGCNFEANTTYDIHIEGAQNCTFLSPRFIGTAGTSEIPVYCLSAVAQSRGVTFKNSRFVGYTFAGGGDGKNIFKIVDAVDFELGQYYLESCTLNGDAEISWGASFLHHSLAAEPPLLHLLHPNYRQTSRTGRGSVRRQLPSPAADRGFLRRARMPRIRPNQRTDQRGSDDFRGDLRFLCDRTTRLHSELTQPGCPRCDFLLFGSRAHE
jgi:hypothetical protein